MPNISLDLYRVFLCVAKCESISGAARILSISQPAVSQQIRQLESALGQTLFVRNARGVSLTEQGRVLEDYASRACAILDAGQAHLNDLRDLKHGEVRIGAGDTLCKHVLLPYLEEFHARHSEIALHVTNRTTRESIALLQNGEVDLAVINLPFEAADIHIHARYAIHDIFVAGPKFFLLAQKPITLAELLAHPLVMLESASSSRRAVDAFFRSHGLSLDAAIELGSLDLVADFARIGLGIGLTVREFVESDLRARRLIPLKLTPPLPARHIAVATREGTALTSAAQAFLDLMEEKG